MSQARTVIAAVVVVLTCAALIGASEEKSDVDSPLVAFRKTKDSLRCGIVLPKRDYKVGDTVTATVLLQNEGTKPLRVVRYDERKNGHRAHFNWQARKPTGPSPFVCECEPDIFRGEEGETLVLRSRRWVQDGP